MNTATWQDHDIIYTNMGVHHEVYYTVYTYLYTSKTLLDDETNIYIVLM